MTDTIRILSIDAWRYNEGWTWNQWFDAGSIDKAEFERIADSPRRLLKWARDNGFLKPTAAGHCRVDDDGYNLVIESRTSGEPLFAFEYGAAID